MDKEDTKYVADILGAKDEKQITRLWIALGIMVLLFVATNTFWIYREFQYEDVVITATETVSQDGSGSNVVGDYYFGGDYGETSGNKDYNN